MATIDQIVTSRMSATAPISLRMRMDMGVCRSAGFAALRLPSRDYMVGAASGK